MVLCFLAIDNFELTRKIAEIFGRMEVDDKMEMFNPWKVDNLDQFLNYCCPECDSKQKSKADFIIHAIDAHPNSREFLPLFDFETDKDDTLNL